MATRIFGIVTAALLSAGLSTSTNADEEKKIFSGPQVGEKLPPLKVKGVVGKGAGEELDFVKLAGDKPTVLIFMHKLTRPSAATTRAILTFASKKKSSELFSGMIYLAGDATEGEKQLKRAQRAFGVQGDVVVGISPDGAEGPGPYGLNRNVTLTILVASKGKVTANFPLVQPGVQADVMNVVKEIVKHTGDKLPRLEEIAGRQYAGRKKAKQRPAGQLDEELANLLRAVIQPDNKPEDVDKAVKNLDEYFKKKPRAKQQVGDVARRIVNAGRLDNYGTPRAREHIKKWAKEFDTPQKDGKPKANDRKAGGAKESEPKSGD